MSRALQPTGEVLMHSVASPRGPGDLGPPALSHLVTLQFTCAGRVHEQVNLPAGGSVRFGFCEPPCCVYEVRTPGLVGEVAAIGDQWSVSNHGEIGCLRVRHLERVQDNITVRPGEVGVPIPFDLARISGASDYSIVVFGPEARKQSVASCKETDRGDARLNPQTLHYRVLLLLSRERLAGNYVDPLPTSREIAARLGISERNVNAHIDYLFVRLGVSSSSTSTIRGSRRERLVEHAITYGWISSETAELAAVELAAGVDAPTAVSSP